MTSVEAGPADPADLTIVPANEATRADLAAVFSAAGSGRCACQFFKARGWIEYSFFLP